MTAKQKLSTHPVTPVPKLTTQHRNSFLEPLEQTHRLLAKNTDEIESQPTTGHIEQYKGKCPSCSPNFKLETPSLHLELQWQTGEYQTKLPRNPEVVWQQLLKTSPGKHKLNNIYNYSAIKTNQTTQKPENKQQTSPPKKSPIKKLRSCYGAVSAKSHRERNSIVPQSLRQLPYWHPRLKEAHNDYHQWRN